MSVFAIGLMTGSSMDGIDSAIIKTDGKTSAKSISGLSVSYTPYLRTCLRLAEYVLQQEEGDLDLANNNFNLHKHNYFSLHSIQEQQKFSSVNLQSIITDLTMLHAELVENLLIKSGLTIKEIEVIGFHGQNLYHNPAKRLTIQIGDGQLLANQTSCSVVSNFRENDIKNGGQGAPFAPLYHHILASNKKIIPVAIVNCGGIANITIINSSNESEIISFDTGPGNVLVDRYIREMTMNIEFMDENGKYGNKGVISPSIMDLLKENTLISYGDKFFDKKPPKSLDSRHFNLVEEIKNLSIENACANLEAFTAKSIVDSLDLCNCEYPVNWVLAGGGFKNPVITKFFKIFLQQKINSNLNIYHADEIGWSGQFMEAEIFAYLAVRSLNKLPLSLPNTTGVNKPMLGGKVYSPELLSSEH